MSDILFWAQIVLLPVPEEAEPLAALIWLSVTAIGLYYGFEATVINKRHPAHRLLGRALVHILVLSVVFLAYSLFNDNRIKTQVDYTNRTIVSIVLPLQACGNAADYFPGGIRQRGARVDELRQVVKQPACMIESRLALFLYLLLSAAFFIVAGALGGLTIKVASTLPIFHSSNPIWLRVVKKVIEKYLK